MDRTLCDPARDPALRQSRRRSVRSAQGHPARYARERCHLRREAPPLDDRCLRTAPRCRRASASWPRGACLPPIRRSSRVSTRFAARSTTPAAGRTRRSTSPASVWASSAPAPPRFSRSRSSPSRRSICSFSSARRTTRCRPTTHRWIPNTSAGSRPSTPPCAAARSRCSRASTCASTTTQRSR